jgi:hypothetical protein
MRVRGGWVRVGERDGKSMNINRIIKSEIVIGDVVQINNKESNVVVVQLP